jgi:hypothetical protein
MLEKPNRKKIYKQKLEDILTKINKHDSKKPSKQSIKALRVQTEIQSLKKVFKEAIEGFQTPFNKTNKYQEGKNRILQKAMLKNLESLKKEEKITNLFKNSSSEEMIDSKMMKDKEILDILKKNKRSFGRIESLRGQHKPFPLRNKKTTESIREHSSSKILGLRDSARNFTQGQIYRNQLLSTLTKSPKISATTPKNKSSKASISIQNIDSALKKYTDEAAIEIELMKYKIFKYLF